MTALRDDRAGSALRVLCACLAFGRDEEAARIAAGGGVDWPRVLKLAGDHLVTPSLASSLRASGLFARLDGEVQEVLDAVHALNRQRNDMLAGQVGEVARALNAAGITPHLVKGAVALLPGQYAGAQDRIIGDLDMVVPMHSLRDAEEALTAIGYRSASGAFRWMMPKEQRGMHHLPPLLHSALPVSVEIHHRPILDPQDNAALVANMALESVVLPSGARVLISGPAGRLVHSFLHSQITDGLAQRRMVSLRQLLEFSALAVRHAGDISPGAVQSCLQRKRLRALAEYWAIAEDWLGAPFPPGLKRSPGARRNLYVTEKVTSRRGWRMVSDLYVNARHLPVRSANLLVRLGAMPGYFPAKLRSLFRGSPRD